MLQCAGCSRLVRIHYNTPGYSHDQKTTIIVASDYKLSRKDTVQYLGRRLKGLNLSRREIPNWIANAVFFFEGRILWSTGTPFELSDTGIDDVFGDDASCRWCGYLLRFADVPPKQRPQARVLPRLRLISLALSITDLATTYPSTKRQASISPSSAAGTTTPGKRNWAVSEIVAATS